MGLCCRNTYSNDAFPESFLLMGFPEIPLHIFPMCNSNSTPESGSGGVLKDGAFIPIHSALVLWWLQTSSQISQAGFEGSLYPRELKPEALFIFLPCCSPEREPVADSDIRYWKFGGGGGECLHSQVRDPQVTASSGGWGMEYLVHTVDTASSLHIRTISLPDSFWTSKLASLSLLPADIYVARGLPQEVGT